MLAYLLVALLQRRLVFLLPAKIASLALLFLYFLRRSSIFSFFLFLSFFLETNRWQTKGDDETRLDEFQGVERAQGNFRPRTEGLENLGNARCTKEGDSFEIPMEIWCKLTRRLKIFEWQKPNKSVGWCDSFPQRNQISVSASNARATSGIARLKGRLKRPIDKWIKRIIKDRGSMEIRISRCTIGCTWFWQEEGPTLSVFLRETTIERFDGFSHK